jgi:hypothetical protein
VVVIFDKTAKGWDEVKVRSGHLTPRQRRALILVNGKYSVDELRELLLADDLQHTLGMLEEEGYITAAGLRQPASDELKPLPPEGLPPIAAFRPLPEPPDPQELEMARNFIINSLRNLYGHYAHLHIVERAAEATTHDELRQLFDPWLHLIVQSRDGKRRAEEWRGQLLKVI